MAWERKQVVLLKIAQKELGWNPLTYQNVLRNAGGVREYLGKISSTNPANDQGGFERVMAFCESCGFIDRVNGQGYWTQKAAKQTERLKHAIIEHYDRCQRHHLFNSPDALAGYVERMTKERPVEQGGVTRSLDECGPIDLFKIFEGLKKWTWRRAQELGVTMNA